MFKDNNVKTPQELLEYFIDYFRYGFTYKK